LAWFVLPIGAAVILQPTMYDNFRQFLFATPPIFLLAGQGIHAALQRLRRLEFVVMLWLVTLLPGLYGLVQLHPYQYVYYNLLIGGVAGAARNYELDYWAISYQQAALFLNQTAPPGARVIVWGADHLVQRIARSDMEIVEYRKVRDQDASAFDYAVILTRHDKDLTLYLEASQVLSISRGGAAFTVVKQLSDPDDSP
jgi:hypothetical protein